MYESADLNQYYNKQKHILSTKIMFFLLNKLTAITISSKYDATQHL